MSALNFGGIEISVKPLDLSGKCYEAHIESADGITHGAVKGMRSALNIARVLNCRIYARIPDDNARAQRLARLAGMRAQYRDVGNRVYVS